VNDKKEELKSVKRHMPIQELEQGIKHMPDPKDFTVALNNSEDDRIRIIAEVKKASPSKGIICEDFSPVSIAKQYEAHGAAAISVLTETKYFMGNIEYLRAVKQEVRIPVLRKDFIFDPYQIYETRYFGADAILFIVALLSKEELKDLLQIADNLSLFHLVEIHSRDELTNALEAGADVIGINNRDLNTFKTDINTTIELMKEIPSGKIIVSESGIANSCDIQKLKASGVDAFLIGETLMKEKEPGKKLKELIEAC
jgi:indole-3-glycerol phosphate synthase